MIDFEILDMTCGHCRAAITQAIHAVDGAAEVQVDMLRHRVQIRSPETNAQRIRDAITAEGYTPVPVATHREGSAAAGPGGCSCASNPGSCGMRLTDLVVDTVPRTPAPRATSCCSGGGSSCRG